MFIRVKNLVVLSILAVMAVAISSCANTSMIESWKDADVARSYKHPMIIGVSDSQQTRQIYEKYFVAELKKKKISATPSYELINSKQKMNRETVVAAIQGTEIDAVLVSYLISADVEIKHRDSPLGATYSGTAEGSQISATIVSSRGRSRSEEVFVLKTDLYDVQSKTMVWSVQSKTVGPESIDEVVTDVTALLIERMFSDGIIK
ncbi:MAG: hypothetical protein GQ550_02065 [Gammaproteobacteria bacterium]|nr:hypothetical protein [Gammaproteobacteria bacterium]